jgi:hypothetical protein
MIRDHYWSDFTGLTLQSLSEIEAEIEAHRSDVPEVQVKSAVMVGAIATSMWGSGRRSDEEYSWIRDRVSEFDCFARILYYRYQFMQFFGFLKQMIAFLEKLFTPRALAPRWKNLRVRRGCLSL